VDTFSIAAAFAGRSCMLGVGDMLVHVRAHPCKFVFGCAIAYFEAEVNLDGIPAPDLSETVW
jgi:hypothetical protein